MNTDTPGLPTPHLDKLKALLNNRRLPTADKPRVEEAIKKYQKWIVTLNKVKPGLKDTVTKLVDTTNTYKKYIELNLVYDSPEDFFYGKKDN